MKSVTLQELIDRDRQSATIDTSRLSLEELGENNAFVPTRPCPSLEEILQIDAGLILSTIAEKSLSELRPRNRWGQR